MDSSPFAYSLFKIDHRARKDRRAKVKVLVAIVASKMLPQTTTTPMMLKKITRYTAARITMLAPRMRMYATTTTTTMAVVTTTT